MNIDKRTGISPLRSAFRRLMFLGACVTAAGSAVAQNKTLSAFDWEYMPIVQGLGLAFTPDGKTVAVGGVGGVQLINTSTRAQRSLPAMPNQDFNAVAISPDGKSLALGGNDFEIWNLASGKQTASPTFNGFMVNSIAYSPNGRWIAVSGFGLSFFNQQPVPSPIVQVYNASTLMPVGAPLMSKGGESNCVVFSKDSQHLIEAGSASMILGTPGYVNIWDLSSMDIQMSLSTKASGSVNSVALSSDGNQLAVAGSDSSGAVLEIWDWQHANLTRTVSAPPLDQLRSVAWSPDQKLLAVSGSDGTAAIVQTWNPATGKLVHSFNAKGSLNAQAVTFSPNGKTIANCQGSTDSSIVASPGAYLQLWNASTDMLEGSADTIGSYGSMAAAFSPDGKVVAQPWTSQTGNTIRLLNAGNGELIRSLPSQISTGLGPVAYSQTGYVADGGILTSQQGSVKKSTGLVEVWNPDSNQREFSLTSSANVSISSIGISNDGTKLAVGGTNAGGGVVELWSATHRKLLFNLKTLATGSVNCVAVSPDGKFVAVGGQDAAENGLLEIWDSTSGKMIENLATSCALTVRHLSFSPDGKTLAVAGYPSSDGYFNVEFWDTKDWSRATPFTLNGAINGIAFTHDGKSLLFNWGYTLVALSVEYGVVFAQYADAGFGSVAVSPLSDRIVTTSFNGEILGMADTVNSVVWATGVSVTPGSIVGGASTTGTVTLSAPAPLGGLSLHLFVNSTDSTITCPSTVVVPAGKTAASFKISSSPVTSPVTAVLGVQSNGNFVTARCTFTVTP